MEKTMAMTMGYLLKGAKLEVKLNKMSPDSVNQAM